MFLMMGINDGRKDFNFSQMMLCGHCGRYGTCQVFMTYMVLWLFFIPVFRWNKHYYVQMSCCGAFYELNPQVGKQIARGKDVQITQADLTYVSPGGAGAGYGGFGDAWGGSFQNNYGNGWNGYGQGPDYGGGGNYRNGSGSGGGYGNASAGRGWRVSEPDDSAGSGSGRQDSAGAGNGGQNAGGAGEQKTGQRRCPSCGAMVDRSFAYCPHCGQRLG